MTSPHINALERAERSSTPWLVKPLLTDKDWDDWVYHLDCRMDAAWFACTKGLGGMISTTEGGTK